MHESMSKPSSVSPDAVDWCRRHDISVIAGACPMMFGDNVDFGHTCMRWMLKLTGGLPTYTQFPAKRRLAPSPEKCQPPFSGTSHLTCRRVVTYGWARVSRM